MSHSAQAIPSLSPSFVLGRRLAWLMAWLPALVAVCWLAPTPARAGTITIVDGPDTPPAAGIYTDGYIQSYLAITGSLTISTTEVVTGPDEILVAPGAVIAWTTGNQLTLDAGEKIVIAGAIQQDGPANGAGGLRLLVSRVPTGTVAIGTGFHTADALAGSRFGLTRVRAGNLVMRGSDTDAIATLLGFRALKQGAAYTVTGVISVTVSQNVSVVGGLTDNTFAQIGHGGGDPTFNGTSAGKMRGPITVEAGGFVYVSGGKGEFAYAQIGNGGRFSLGDHGGSHRLTANGLIGFEAGTGPGQYAYAQFGNGGVDSAGNHSGNLRLAAGTDVSFLGGYNDGYALLGNGGFKANGNLTGNHTVTAGGEVTFHADGFGYEAFAQLGNGGFNANGTHSGNHSLTAPGAISFRAGNFSNNYAQFGNGGYEANGNASGGHKLNGGATVSFRGAASYTHFGNGGYDANGDHSGRHTLDALDDVSFQSGDSNDNAYAQFGNGGQAANGGHSGGHTLHTTGDVTFLAGATSYAYAHFGNGGSYTGDDAGNHVLQADGNVTFQAGEGFAAYAQYGNGGYDAEGNETGNHRLDAGGDVTFRGGNNSTSAYAQLGNGGYDVDGNHSGGHSLTAGGAVLFAAGAYGCYVQLGNGGYDVDGTVSGSHTLDARGNVLFLGGDADAYAQFGNGGDNDGEDGSTLSGDQTLTAGGFVSFAGGRDSVAYAQFGNGGTRTNGSFSGKLSLTSAAELNLIAGGNTDAYAMIGHGADARGLDNNDSTGNRAGDVEVRVGATAVFSGSQVGHVSANGIAAVTAGNTLIGVSRNDPNYATGAGQFVITGNRPSHFTSAPAANGGELRIYLPREESAVVPTSATFNGSSFATADVIPAAQLMGYFAFGAGPYAPPYSFYLGPRAEVAVVKRAVPAGPLNLGQHITYTISFSNTGTLTATSVTIEDPLPSAVTFSSATPQPDAGVTITPTAGAPNLAWGVSNLVPGKGGRIRIVTTLNNSALLLGTTFTNTATISAADSGVTENDRASVAASVIPGATLLITKTVVGDPPADAWQFTGSGTIGAFSLPAGGGNQTFTQLLPATYTVSETAKPGFTAAVSCTNGQTGANSVSVTLASGQQVGCTFTNTKDAAQTGAVEGLVYIDATNSAQPDPGEGLQGVTVTLQSATGVAAALTVTDTTDANGEYGFADVPVGDYTLSFAPPAGYLPIDAVPVTVTAGQTTQVPDQPAVPEGPSTPGDVFLPVLQR